MHQNVSIQEEKQYNAKLNQKKFYVTWRSNKSYNYHKVKTKHSNDGFSLKRLEHELYIALGDNASDLLKC